MSSGNNEKNITGEYIVPITVNDKCDHVGGTPRRDKREVSPSSSVGSGGDRSKKKRKASHVSVFDGVEVEKGFHQGMLNKDNNNNNCKSKVGRKSVKKAFEMARKTGVCGLGEYKKGMLDAYKEFYEVDSVSNGISSLDTTQGENQIV